MNIKAFSTVSTLIITPEPRVWVMTYSRILENRGENSRHNVWGY
jgi:hypothetical protein